MSFEVAVGGISDEVVAKVPMSDVINNRNLFT
jgi:hypothetical protein